jgi:hypothetical protein
VLKVSLNNPEKNTESEDAGCKDGICSALYLLTGFGINSVESSGSCTGA